MSLTGPSFCRTALRGDHPGLSHEQTQAVHCWQEWHHVLFSAHPIGERDVSVWPTAGAAGHSHWVKSVNAHLLHYEVTMPPLYLISILWGDSSMLHPNPVLHHISTYKPWDSLTAPPFLDCHCNVAKQWLFIFIIPSMFISWHKKELSFLPYLSIYLAFTYIYHYRFMDCHFIQWIII